MSGKEPYFFTKLCQPVTMKYAYEQIKLTKFFLKIQTGTNLYE
jgi:hypothetical protein